MYGLAQQAYQTLAGRHESFSYELPVGDLPLGPRFLPLVMRDHVLRQRGVPFAEVWEHTTHRQGSIVKRVVVRFEENRDEANIQVLFRASSADAQVEELMNRVRDPFVGSLAVVDPNGSTVLLPLERIASISSCNKRLKVVADDETYSLKASLQETERMLVPNMFLRISRYEIVNLRKVHRFDFTMSGTLRIEFDHGAETWASRRYIPAIRQRLKEGS